MKKTAELPEDFKVCETCKHYRPEFNLDHGACLKDEEWPVAFEPFETCNDWEADDD